MPSIAAIKSLLFRLIAPPYCLGCLTYCEHELPLCLDCFSWLPWAEHSCPQCGCKQFIPQRCGHCLQHQPAFDQTIAACLYEPPISRWISHLKFHHQLPIAPILSQLLIKAIAQQHPLNYPQQLMVVPLHRQRLQHRGFNQALLIARPISRALGIPINTQAIKRIKPTRPQVGLSASQRQSNVRHAFQIDTSLACDHVAIIDDVMTTGSTLNAIAQQLKKAGVKRVDNWVVARAQPHATQ